MTPQSHPILWPFSRSDCNGKEKDWESGFHYYGARYYWSEMLTGWLSVDPMMDKYPGISPYAYCVSNPVKLIDPNGMKIRNAYESYRNVGKDIDFYRKQMQNCDNEEDRLAYQKEIGRLNTNHANYEKVQQSLMAFKKSAPNEYNVIDKLSYKGKEIDILVSVNMEIECNNDGGIGDTKIRYQVTPDGMVENISSPIAITLYSGAFREDPSGLSTLANEFGDAFFAIKRPQYNYQTNNEGRIYDNIPTTKYSRAYEKYILSYPKTQRPDPYDF